MCALKWMLNKALDLLLGEKDLDEYESTTMPATPAPRYDS